MYIGEILRRGTQNLSYIRWSLIGFCVILYTSCHCVYTSVSLCECVCVTVFVSVTVSVPLCICVS